MIQNQFAIKLQNNELFMNTDISNMNFEDLKLKMVDLKKGEILFREGDPANSIYLVLDGEINLIKKQTFGNAHFLFSKDKFFGQEEYFLKTGRTSIAIALKDSRIVELSKEDIDSILSQHDSVLNNIKNSLEDINLIDIKDFKVVKEELYDTAEKFNSIFQMELTTKDENEKSFVKSSDDKVNIPGSEKLINDKSDFMKIESEISKIIKSIKGNLLQLEKERSKILSMISDYEKEAKKQLDEIKELKDREDEYFRLDKEKNEIIGQQSHSIIQLEKERARLKDLELMYSQKIESLSNREADNNINLQKLESELKEKDNIISKLESDLKENTKIISNFSETRLKLLQEKEDQDSLIKTQEAGLKNLTEKIESLSKELSEKDIYLTKLNEDLLNKNGLITEQTNKLNEINTEIEEVRSSLIKKNKVIERLSSDLYELQNQLRDHKEGEKNKDELILNQSYKMAEYDEEIKNSKKELSLKEEIINNFIQDIGDLSTGLWHKQNEINDQAATINKLNNEIAKLKQTFEDFFNKEVDVYQKISDLESELAKANKELDALLKDVEEKTTLIQTKEKENTLLNTRVLEIQENLDEVKNSLEGRNNKINDLEEVIARLKNELPDQSELNKLKDDFSTVSIRLTQKDKDYSELSNEKNNLLEKVKNLELIIEKNKNEGNDNLSELKEELDTLRREAEKYKSNAFEKDKIIEEQKKQVENLRLSKAEILKALTSTKGKYDEDIKKKDDQISELVNRLNDVNKSLEEKILIEEQQTGTIENQAQRIAEFEVIVNEYKIKDEHKDSGNNEGILANSSGNIDSSDNGVSKGDKEILSKCKFIKSQSANTYKDDKSFECLEYSGIYIVNINMSRATMESASLFSKFLFELINTNKAKLIVNLSSCEFVDSSILGALVNALKKVSAIGGDLRIVWLDHSEDSMFYLTRMDKVFQIFYSLRNAVESYL